MAESLLPPTLIFTFIGHSMTEEEHDEAKAIMGLVLLGGIILGAFIHYLVGVFI
jgi:hypothetical protein